MENRQTYSITVNAVTITVLEGDITCQDTMAIVNAANSSLRGGGGVDGAIHRAGGPLILGECKQIIARIGRLAPGKAVITSGGSLAAKYVVHTVGPVWHDGNNGEAATLKNAYLNSLLAAQEKGITSLSFPSISTGAYRFPAEHASKIAISTVIDFARLNPQPNEIRFVLFTQPDFEIYKSRLQEYGD